MGLELNELADTLAGANLPCVNPPTTVTTSSSCWAFMAQALSDWHSQTIRPLRARRIQPKIRHTPMQPQLWGVKGRQLSAMTSASSAILQGSFQGMCLLAVINKNSFLSKICFVQLMVNFKIFLMLPFSAPNIWLSSLHLLIFSF